MPRFFPTPRRRAICVGYCQELPKTCRRQVQVHCQRSPSPHVFPALVNHDLESWCTTEAKKVFRSGLRCFDGGAGFRRFRPVRRNFRSGVSRRDLLGELALPFFFLFPFLCQISLALFELVVWFCQGVTSDRGWCRLERVEGRECPVRSACVECALPPIRRRPIAIGSDVRDADQ